MRDYKKDLGLLNKVDDDLYIYMETYESGHGDYIRYFVDVNNCDKYEPTMYDVEFLNQAKEKWFYII